MSMIESYTYSQTLKEWIDSNSNEGKMSEFINVFNNFLQELVSTKEQLYRTENYLKNALAVNNGLPIRFHNKMTSEGKKEFELLTISYGGGEDCTINLNYPCDIDGKINPHGISYKRVTNEDLDRIFNDKIK